MDNKILSKIVEILKSPYKSIEEADARTWLKYCEDDLLKVYRTYLEAKARLDKATQSQEKLI
jgi:hypothetical protein